MIFGILFGALVFYSLVTVTNIPLRDPMKPGIPGLNDQLTEAIVLLFKLYFIY